MISEQKECRIRKEIFILGLGLELELGWDYKGGMHLLILDGVLVRYNIDR